MSHVAADVVDPFAHGPDRSTAGRAERASTPTLPRKAIRRPASFGGQMNLDDTDCAAARFVIAEFTRRRRLTGRPIPPAVARLHHRLTSVGGHEPPAPQPDSKSEQPELLDTAEVAELLGCSTRHVRRIAAALDAHQIGGRWLYPKPAVVQHLQGRHQ
ncbi:helix-turn-helix domain-containing protein [Gordonia sp. DT219]|uniref:helix-turn-helix domain-containing protein n=1 Tax=Gordonia sp. DT219 TaxID=3416658 RepID=UPI003CF5CEC7